MAEWYLYMIRCRDGSLYTGISTEVLRRLEEHRGTGNKGARYLRGRGPLELVYTEKIGFRALALKAEHKVKKLPKSRKEALARHGRDQQIKDE
jgi:putative endonuclease